jgi:hypothetical protein
VVDSELEETVEEIEAVDVEDVDTSWSKQERGEGMATSYQARSSRKGWEDQVDGGDLSTLSANQGVPDCGLLLAKVEG